VVGASGCDLSPPAATVNGATISQSSLNAILSSAIGHPAAVCALQLQSGSSTSPVGVGTEDDGSTPNAVTPGFADSILESLVLQKLEQQTLARHGITVTAADVTAAQADYEGQLEDQLSQASSDSATPSGCGLSTSSAVGGQLAKAFLARQAGSLADQEMFEVAVGHVDLGPGALLAYYKAHRAEVTQECLNLVISDTQAGAQSLHDEIAAGTTFTTASTSSEVNQQVSPTGGQIPCAYPAQISGELGATIGAEVDAMAAGQLSEPLALQVTGSTGTPTTYYLVIQMRAHQLVPFATLRTSIREAVLEAHSAVVRTAFNGLVDRAHISVDSRYGTWSAKGGVTVPTPAAPAVLLNVKANVPTTSALTIGGGSINPASG